ncbi:MAG: UDP-N-acetylmuramoyl-L-alanyl-D-glutamate--2,6-diaminopimelate ligase [Porphyromonadaceae bacterium]|nr:UDP-N-acetylmuramoyl-L-alanyl-D-glutamate--2,6-diaminopimelate ligase [Porphyromonadaceae bacterium]
MLLHSLVQQGLSLTSGDISLKILGDAAVEITSIEQDSRRVQPGTLFVAIRGTLSDGHTYIDQAIDKGAVAVLTEVMPEQRREGICYVVCSDTRLMYGLCSSAWFGHPSREVKVVGVTGTNGKTTTATLLYHLFTSLGYPCGLISTVRNLVGRQELASTHTTPEAYELHRLLRQMVEVGCSYVFMEVSSHAVDQHRVAGLHFEGGIFTNLTRDHLDYHGTFGDYLRAKQRFFDTLPRSSFAVSNADDRNGEVMLQNSSARKLYYGLKKSCEIKGQILEEHSDSTLLAINEVEVTTRLIGAFNAYNVLAVYAAALELGVEREEVLQALSMLSSVDGRLETICTPQGYTVVVDYAHTPDALANVLQTLGHLNDKARGDGRIICVVGCGGDRDRGKRPIMASEALAGADYAFFTSDNPRTETPESILEDMIRELPETERHRYSVVIDRTEAIYRACSVAREGDFVLIAGKGHETYQEIYGVKHPFDDREVVRTYLQHV